MPWTRIVVVAAGLALAGPAGLGAQGAAEVSGCYRFDHDYFRWVGRRPGQRTVVRDSTAVIRLLEYTERRRGFGGDSVRDVVPVPFVADSATQADWLDRSYWTVVDSRTVRVAWRNGLFGPVFTLTPAGDTLRGRVRHTTDIVGAERPSEPATAVRVACP
jgi:hypothetical protein